MVELFCDARVMCTFSNTQCIVDSNPQTHTQLIPKLKLLLVSAFMRRITLVTALYCAMPWRGRGCEQHEVIIDKFLTN